MNDFDQRWQTLARNAGALLEEALPEQPCGFAARVLARSRESVPESWEDVLRTLGLPAILATGVAAIVAAGLAFYDWYDVRIERPAVERTFTNELPWP